ncbi:hypothetical protein [Microcoleus sp. herbarium12]
MGRRAGTLGQLAVSIEVGTRTVRRLVEGTTFEVRMCDAAESILKRC